MKSKIITISILLILVLGSFGAVNSKNVETQEDTDCGCCNGSSGGLTGEDIEALRLRGEEEGWTFTVGENSAIQYPLSVLCPLSLDSDDWWVGAKFDPCRPTGDIGTLSLPDSFDWRDNSGVDYTTPVKSQGNCGGCWAFATTAPLECNINYKDGYDAVLSEQYLLSCNTNNWGCEHGGWEAHDYFLNTEGSCGGIGGVLNDDYPYTESDSSCDGSAENKHAYVIEDWAYIGEQGFGYYFVPEPDQIKYAIYNYGPVTVGIHVDSAFQAYTGGVFNEDSYGPINHMVTLVGWDDNPSDGGPDCPGVWMLRNSWGSGLLAWGEQTLFVSNGHMRIEYNCSRVGYRASYIEYSDPDDNSKNAVNYDSKSGEVKDSGNSVILSEGDGSGNVFYKFHVGKSNSIENYISVGIEYAEEFWAYQSDGPEIFIKRKNTEETYDKLGDSDLGKKIEYMWKWRVATPNIDDYIDDDGNIEIKIHAEGGDHTYLRKVGIKYKQLPVPDLDASGTLSWTGVETSVTKTGTITINNIGDPYSSLHWKIDSKPSCVTSISPIEEDESLTPEDGATTLTVSVKASSEKETELGGDIKIINVDKPSDYKIIHVSITTPRNRLLISLIFIHFLNQMPMLRSLFSFFFPLF